MRVRSMVCGREDFVSGDPKKTRALLAGEGAALGESLPSPNGNAIEEEA